jgi:hypothetical protein
MHSDSSENPGGGTGGGPEPGDHNQAFEGHYGIAANQVELVARPPLPPAVPGQSVISILAAGLGIDGLVEIRGSQGVRVTAGPPPLLPASSATTNGVEILTSETGTLTLQRGLLPIDQKMEMTPGGITIDAGVGKVTIKSLTQIELSVCEGLTKLTLGPEGVTIQALQINLSAQLQAQIQGLMTQLTGTAMTQISGGITMIG